MTDIATNKFGITEANPKPASTGDKIIPPKEVWYHNWLYSVVPASERTEDWGVAGQPPSVSYPLGIYLAGYCKNCNRSFTIKLPHDQWGIIKYSGLGIEKEGCVGPPR